MSKSKNPFKESLILGKILKKLAPKIGAKVLIEPNWNVVGQIEFKNGKRSYFRYNTLDLNPLGSSEIAKDKDYANFFMQSLGFPIVPRSKTFFSDEWAKAIKSKNRTIDYAFSYAEKIGFPVVVKPNSGSQGKGVSFVQNKREFYRAMRTIFHMDKIALVQKPVKGRDYRIVVLNNKIISAYERTPLNVVGDGKSSILKLLNEKQKYFYKVKRGTLIKTDDPRIAEKLARQKMSFSEIPPKGECVYLLDNANLSSGGDAVDVTKNIHKKFEDIAIHITREMGLNFCGVDLIIEGDISEAPKKYWILEINAAPGLDHYTKHGVVQEKIVEDLYLQVLKNLEK